MHVTTQTESLATAAYARAQTGGAEVCSVHDSDENTYYKVNLRRVGIGGTGMKSNDRKFEKYGISWGVILIWNRPLGRKTTRWSTEHRTFFKWKQETIFMCTVCYDMENAAPCRPFDFSYQILARS